MHIEQIDEHRFDYKLKALPPPRLDVFLAGRMTGLSRARIQQLIAGGNVIVNGQPARKRRGMMAGDQVVVRIPVATTPVTPAPEAIPLSILYEDHDIIVIDKPPGLVTHPAPGHGSGTLVNALLHHCGDLTGIGGERRPGIVHRLDKDTSGVMVAAKNEAAFLALSHQFRQRAVEKEYCAIVHRIPSPTEGRIEAALARHPRDRQRFAVTRQGGRNALTFYRVRETFPAACLLDVRIATGRTHQIRVHMSWLGHPILGDSRYGGERRLADGALIPRQMLHAQRLQFSHPISSRRLSIESPLPPDMQVILTALRNTPSNCRS